MYSGTTKLLTVCSPILQTSNFPRVQSPQERVFVTVRYVVDTAVVVGAATAAPVDDHLCCAYSTFHPRSLVGCCEIRMTVQSKVILYSGATCILTTNDTRAMFLTL